MLSLCKAKLRQDYLGILKGINPERRYQATKEATRLLVEKLEDTYSLLSFFPIHHEIDLRPFNQRWMQEKALYLPRITQDLIEIVRIEDLDSDLELSDLGFWEPRPSLAASEPLHLECALIPGLAFDKRGSRLGRGKGHFDRFLAALNHFSPRPHKIGIGFLEQLEESFLPEESHDERVDELLLF